MKKILTILVILLGFFSTQGHSAYNNPQGFFFHLGFTPTFIENVNFNTILTAQGFNSMGEVTYGLSIGTGMLMQNMFYGWRLNTSLVPLRSENATSGVTIESSFTDGGFEVGYALINNPYYCFIPSLSFIWGSTGYDISSSTLTNTTLTGALANPAQFVSLQKRNFTLGIALHNLIKFEVFQIYFRAEYQFTPAETWTLKGGGDSAANLIGAPAPGNHRVALTVGFAIGFIEPVDKPVRQRKESRYQAPTSHNPK